MKSGLSRGEFDEYATQQLEVKNNIITINTNESGLINTDTINLQQKQPVDNLSLTNENTNSLTLQAASINATWGGMPVSNWIYYSVFYGSNNFTRYTVSAVVGVLTLAATSYFGIVGRYVATGVSSIASLIVSDNLSRVYWRDSCYYKTVIPDDPNQFRRKVAEYNYFIYYTDSSRTNSIGSAKYYYYDPLYQD